jgi:hypothetical protein
MYEAVLSLPLLLVLIFVGIQLMVTGYRSVVLQYAASLGVRQLALGICNGPSLSPDGGSVLNPELAPTSTCPAGTTNAQQARATYAYNYTRLVAARFGLRTSSNPLVENYAAACVLPLNDDRLADTTGSPCVGLGVSIFDGVPGQVTNNAPIGVIQIRTRTGIGIFRALKTVGTEFRNQQRDYLWAFAIARMERI